MVGIGEVRNYKNNFITIFILTLCVCLLSLNFDSYCVLNFWHCMFQVLRTCNLIRSSSKNLVIMFEGCSPFDVDQPYQAPLINNPSSSWLHTTPAQMPWSIPNANQPSVMRYVLAIARQSKQMVFKFAIRTIFR